MDITVTTSIGIPNIIPPRCRSPRYAEILVQVPCCIPECESHHLQLAAEVTRVYGGQLETTELYHAPDVGFLEPTAMAPNALASSLAPPPASTALPPAGVPGQGLQTIDAARVKIQNDAAQYVIVGPKVYRRTPEPCYLLRYTPSFRYPTLDLEVRPVPEYSAQSFGLRDHVGALRGHGHFFNAHQRSEIEALIAELQSARDEPLQVDAQATIAVHAPDVFTFDATRWHTERERADIAHAIRELIAHLNTLCTRSAEFTPLYPERTRLVQQVSIGLQDALATLTADQH